MDQEQLGKHAEQCLRSLGPQGFNRLFNNMPFGRHQRAFSLTLTHCLKGGNRRCKRGSILCDVNGVCSHAVLRNGSSNTMAFLKDGPETAEGKTAMPRNIDISTQETQAPSTLEREPAHRDVRADSKRGVAGLEALSHASPQKPLSLREPPNDKDSDEFAEWVRARIDADTSGLKSDKFRSKTKPSDALKSMCEVEDMNRVYRLCFGVYLRKYTSLLFGLRASAAALKPLKTLCGTLNIDFDLKDLATL